MSCPRTVLQSKRMSPTTAVFTVAALATGIYTFRRFLMGEVLAEEPRQKIAPAADMAFFGKGMRFATLKVHSVEMLDHNMKRVRFELPEPNARAGMPLTSALLTIHRPAGAIFPVFRPYTPVTSPDDRGYLDLIVKKYPNGRASSHIHSLQPGDTLSTAGPLPGYKWRTNEREQINLIAGGAGITPMYQLLQGILSNPDEKTKIKLIFGVHSDEDIVLKKEFETFAREYPNRLDVVYAVSKPNEGSPYRAGRITKELLEKEMLRGGKTFVCGPPSLETALVGASGIWGGKTGILQELGYSKQDIYKF